MQLRVALSFAVLGLVLAFQNCAKSQSASNGGDEASQEKVVGSASSFTKVVYDSQMESPRVGNGLPRVELDLSAGQVKVGERSCALDESRLGSLRALLAQSNVCEPGPLPAGTIVCMAIGLADIELSGAGESVQLRPIVCHSGKFLCDGNDKVLREIVTDLAKNSPCK